MSLASELKKAFGMPSSDGSHTYIFKSGEFGTFFQYWWRDAAGNYFRYSNAADGTPDYQPLFGPPLLDPEQPLIEKNPEFYTEEGFKRHMAIPQGAKTQRNEAYNQHDGRNIWFEAYDNGGPRFVYLDADVKENLDLYVQNQIRVVDGALTKYRMYATDLFTGRHPKDRLTGALLILCDQGYYEPEELVSATVGDISFVDQAVILLGRKFVCDLTFLEFLTSVALGRPPTDPLFQYETVHSTTPVGINYLNAVFYSLRVSPKFLLCWNASHLFSRIVNRMAFQQVAVDEIEPAAMDELARTLSTRDDVAHLVDFKVRVALLRNYAKQVQATEAQQGALQGEPPPVTKSLTRLIVDDFGVAVVRSDLTSFRPDETEFSTWLRNEPMHDLSPVEEDQIAESMEPPKEEPKDQAEENQPVTGNPNAPGSPEDAESAPATDHGAVPA